MEPSLAFPPVHGLQILASPDRSLLGPPSEPCILVMRAHVYAKATADSSAGPIFNGCATNDPPAVVSIKVSRDVPQDLLAEYPLGTALQFAFDTAGGEVVVFSSPE